MDQREQEEIRAWRAIGEIEAFANPDGYIAVNLGQSPEERLQQIWEIVQRIRPQS